MKPDGPVTSNKRADKIPAGGKCKQPGVIKILYRRPLNGVEKRPDLDNGVSDINLEGQNGFGQLFGPSDRKKLEYELFDGNGRRVRLNTCRAFVSGEIDLKG